MRPPRGPVLTTLGPEWGPLRAEGAEAYPCGPPGTASAAPGPGSRSCILIFQPLPLLTRGLLPALPEPGPNLEGSQGKNTEVVCHSFLHWTTFCQMSPP